MLTVSVLNFSRAALDLMTKTGTFRDPRAVA